MALLSVNVNKFALIRNARGTNHPDLLDISRKCLCFGANGITVHPRPDERHAKFSDLSPLKKLVNEFKNTEFNIEGYPTESFIEKVILVKPNQVTLVPDPPDAITSSFGWDCENNRDFLSKVIKKFQDNEIRVSIFISPSIDTLTNLKHIKPNRVELYTYDYAKNYESNNKKAIDETLLEANIVNNPPPNPKQHKINIGLIKYIAPINKNANGTSKNIDKLDGEYTFFSTSDIPK